MRKLYVIGRHPVADLEGAGYVVVKQENVQFPLTDCEDIIIDLLGQAFEMDAALVFQAVPGQVAIAIARLAQTPGRGMPIGVVISVPGERAPDETRRYPLADRTDAPVLESAVEFANPRASVETDVTDVYVTCASPMRFAFSHIEWL